VDGGNPRTPRYVRERTGTVLHRHGAIDNPLDHHQSYPPLYSVVFELLDGTGDEVVADIHEEWLTPELAAEPG
jgi:hypothetical protein